MDGERIPVIKLSGQGSVYIRCLELLEEDERLMTPAYHLCSDDITENPSETLCRSKTVNLHPETQERHSFLKI